MSTESPCYLQCYLHMMLMHWNSSSIWNMRCLPLALARNLITMGESYTFLTTVIIIIIIIIITIKMITRLISAELGTRSPATANTSWANFRLVKEI